MTARILALLGALAAIGTLRLTRSYLVEGDSMRPTLLNGDYVSGLRAPFLRHPAFLGPNAILVARRPDQPHLPIIKRLARREPNGHLWLLGDHPAASTDSRHFGPLSPATVEAVVWLRYWPPHRLRLLAGPFRPRPDAGWIDQIP